MPDHPSTHCSLLLLDDRKPWSFTFVKHATADACDDYCGDVTFANPLVVASNFTCKLNPHTLLFEPPLTSHMHHASQSLFDSLPLLHSIDCGLGWSNFAWGTWDTLVAGHWSRKFPLVMCQGPSHCPFFEDLYPSKWNGEAHQAQLELCFSCQALATIPVVQDGQDYPGGNQTACNSAWQRNGEAFNFKTVEQAICVTSLKNWKHQTMWCAGIVYDGYKKTWMVMYLPIQVWWEEHEGFGQLSHWIWTVCCDPTLGAYGCSA